MPQPQYFRYEQGYRDIPTDILIALADLYKTSTDYILGRTDNSSPPQKKIPQIGLTAFLGDNYYIG